MTNDDKKICVGAFVGAHGVRGLVKLASYTDDPEALFDYAPLTDEAGKREYALTFKGTGPTCYLVAVEGVADRDAAEALKGKKLFAARSVLPPAEEGEYYHTDLMGLEARDEKGAVQGRIEAVHDFGAGVFLEILPPAGKSFMLPFKDAFVPVVDLAAGFAQVVIPEGWLTAEKPPKDKKPKKTRET